MTDVKTVVIQLHRPSYKSKGRVTTGFYIIRDNTVIMTYEDGEPVYRDLEQTLTYNHSLRPGDDPLMIAGALTRTVRRELSGLTEDQEAFGRAIEYPESGVA